MTCERGGLYKRRAPDKDGSGRDDAREKKHRNVETISPPSVSY